MYNSRNIKGTKEKAFYSLGFLKTAQYWPLRSSVSLNKCSASCGSRARWMKLIILFLLSQPLRAISSGTLPLRSHSNSEQEASDILLWHFTFLDPSASQRAKNWCCELKSNGGGNAHSDLSSSWVPFPALTCLHLGCVQVDLSRSPFSQELLRQARQPSTDAALDLSLLAVTKWVLGGESAEVPLIAVKHLANQLLTWALSPWEVSERWCCCHPTATCPPPATSCLRPQGHPCARKCHSCNPVKQDWPLQQLFLFPPPPFPLSHITWAPVSAPTCYSLYSGLAAGSRTSLPSASRSV